MAELAIVDAAKHRRSTTFPYPRADCFAHLITGRVYSFFCYTTLLNTYRSLEQLLSAYLSLALVSYIDTNIVTVLDLVDIQLLCH